MSLIDLAAARFQNGFSCSQSVFSALAGRWDIDPDLSLRIAAGFGGGIARSAGICGCVTGGVMALGLSQQEISLAEDRPGKEKACEVCRRFMSTFEERNGSTICSELLGCDIGTTEGSAKARQEKLHQTRCTKFVRDAVEIVESMLPAEPGAGGR